MISNPRALLSFLERKRLYKRSKPAHREIKICIFGTLFFFFTTPLSPIDPFSKITITSQRATCQRDEVQPHIFLFTYEKNVKVCLADKSIIRAKALEIQLTEDMMSKKPLESLTPSPSTSTSSGITTPSPMLRNGHSKCPEGGNPEYSAKPKTLPDVSIYANDKRVSQSHFKKIIFKGNVRIKKEHRVARADLMEIYPEKHQCLLKGNVVIKQNKKNKKHFPLTTRGELATLDLKTYQVSLEGSPSAPVSTFIRLGEKTPEPSETLSPHKAGKQHDKNKAPLTP